MGQLIEVHVLGPPYEDKPSKIMFIRLAHKWKRVRNLTLPLLNSHVYEITDLDTALRTKHKRTKDTSSSPKRRLTLGEDVSDQSMEVAPTETHKDPYMEHP